MPEYTMWYEVEIRVKTDDYPTEADKYQLHRKMHNALISSVELGATLHLDGQPVTVQHVDTDFSSDFLNTEEGE